MLLLDVPKSLRARLGDEGTEGFIEVLNQVSAAIRDDTLQIVSKHFEHRLSEELGKIRVEMAGLRSEMREGMAELRTELSKEIAQKHVEVIRWMFLFWIGQVAVLAGLILAFFRR